jgi:hypothetical protein
MVLRTLDCDMLTVPGADLTIMLGPTGTFVNRDGALPR